MTSRTFASTTRSTPAGHSVTSGGIDHGNKIWDLLEAGADGVQCYTAVAYRWVAFHKMNYELSCCLQKNGYSSLEEYMEKKRGVV